VLIVEDKPDLHALLGDIFAAEYRVASAFDGGQGLELARRLKPDLILSDLTMPSMGGEELLAAIRRDPDLQPTPVVILTAKSDEGLRGRLVAAGADDCIGKPFAPQEVLARIDQLITARRTAQARFRLVVEAAPCAMVVTDQNGRIVLVNAEVERLFDYPREELLGQPAQMLVPDQGRSSATPFIPRQSASNGHAPAEHLGRRKNGEDFPIEVGTNTVTASEGRLTLVAISDITDRKRTERRQRVMMAELDHRVKNNLSVVLALASSTIASSKNMRDFESAFLGRVAALARLHTSLAQAKWEGTLVRDLVMQALETYLDGRADRVSIEGPEVMIPGMHGQSLCLALHELATNAAKYGALSVPAGMVRVRWKIEPRAGEQPSFELTWTESNGPAVHPPDHEGLGTELIKEGLAYEWHARTEVAYEPEGVRCTIVAPLPTVSDIGAPT
jgi:PAS domain S-box-containing protein